MNSSAESFLLALREHRTHVGVIGLGYVGLPLAMAFAANKFRVTGFDIDQAKIDALRAGRCYIKHLDTPAMRATIASDSFAATDDYAALHAPDALIIAVPTPLSPQREPDMSYVIATTTAIAKTLRKGQLVVLESTTYPGTTDELVKGILESASGLRAGVDFFLAFSPEREDPGNKTFHTASIPKLVGGVDPVSGDLAQSLYAKVIAKTVRVSSARTAEATKLTENVFRAVNIALVNELKVVFDKMGVNIWEVLDAAATKPFGFMRFNPGPGWGGHCIPLDPFYLSWKAREFGVAAKFVELAGEVNVAMPSYVVHKLQDALNDAGKAVKESRILLIGLAYKKDVDDTRESPAFEIMHLLDGLGAVYDYHDPHVPTLPPTRRFQAKAGIASVALSADGVEAYDAVMIVTDHAVVDYALIAAHARLIVDTRGVYQQGERGKFPTPAGKLVMA